MHHAIKAAMAAIIFTSSSVMAREAIDLGWQPPDWSLDPAVETFGHYATNGFDPGERELRQIDLFFELQAKRPSMERIQGFRIEVSEQDLIDIGQRPGEPSQALREERRFLVGVTKKVHSHVNFSKAELRAANSQGVGHKKGLLRNQNGVFTWAAPALSEGATAVRVLLSGVELAQGAELYVYSDLGQAQGPFTGTGPWGDGEFWSETMAGSSLAIQLHGSEDALTNSQFTIAELGHIGPRFRAAKGLVPKPFLDPNPEGCTGATCIIDGSCADNNDWSIIEDIRKSVAHIQFVDGAWIYLCSGGLLADSAASGRPLFLTANHCISRSRVAQSMNTYFNYQTSGCGNCNVNPVQATRGATILAKSKTSDFTLMELAENPPSGAYFASTSSTPVANNNGTALFRISHPHGEPQSYTEHLVDTSRGTCGGWPRGDWIYSEDIVGSTQGGSSGSPVFNGAGQVVGQLTGGCGTNINDDCDADSNATVDGALAAYYDQVAEFLAPGSCTPSEEICDEKDNDCDGLIDEGLDCGGGDPGLPPGAPCKRDNQCASNECLGKGRNRVCGE